MNWNAIALLGFGVLLVIAAFVWRGVYSTTGNLRNGYVRTNRFTGAMVACVGFDPCKPVTVVKP